MSFEPPVVAGNALKSPTAAVGRVSNFYDPGPESAVESDGPPKRVVGRVVAARVTKPAKP
jgi:hypothetical protein